VTLTEWIDKRIAKFSCTRHVMHQNMCDQLAKAGTPISLNTIAAVDRGMKLSMYDKAKALSDLTGGAVSVAELCE